MTDVMLPGLLGSNPLGALASFGLLRILDQQQKGVRLKFVLTDDWSAVIESDTWHSPEEIIQDCARWVAQRDDVERSWADDVRVPPSEYRAQREMQEPGCDVERFLSAFAAEGVEDKRKGLIKPCPLYMVSAKQSFFGRFADTFSSVIKKPHQLFRDTLIGPWRYRTATHHLGWDPACERLHALRHRSPTGEPPRCEAAATLLAYEAMAWLPSFAMKARATSSAFTRSERGMFFRWPVVTNPASAMELRTLIQTQAFANSDARLRGGIAEVYRAERYSFGQGYAVFRPAQLDPLE